MQFLARSLSKSIRPSLTTTVRKSWILSQEFHSTISTSSSRSRVASRTKESESVTPEKSSEWSRPKEIPYQPKAANSVNLIGYVDQPVQFEATNDGKFWAGTVISQRASSASKSELDSSHNLWIPVIFEGDLAHTAASHLKKNDRVHIAGQLFVDAIPSNLSQAHVQVMVHDLHYVDGSQAATKVLATSDQKEGVLKHSASLQKGRDFGTDQWRDLLEKPEEWWEYRENKQNGSVSPRHPDFKKKDGSVALWLNNAPKAILSELEGMKFETPIYKLRQAKQQNGEESWKDLVENMDKWWDNRVDKRNERAPDFKHKESGLAIWLSDSPSWVMQKLPPPEIKTSDRY